MVDDELVKEGQAMIMMTRLACFDLLFFSHPVSQSARNAFLNDFCANRTHPHTSTVHDET